MPHILILANREVLKWHIFNFVVVIYLSVRRNAWPEARLETQENKLCLRFGMHYFLSFLVCNHLEEEERADCFAFIVSRLSCYCKCHVALPHGAVGWSAVCDCSIPDHTHLLFGQSTNHGCCHCMRYMSPLF